MSNRTEFGSHVWDSAADHADLRNYGAYLERATVEEIASLKKRDRLLRLLGVPPLSNHRALCERFGGLEDGFVALKVFRSMPATFKDFHPLQSDEVPRALEAVVAVLEDKDLDARGKARAVKDAAFRWTDRRPEPLGGDVERRGRVCDRRHGVFRTKSRFDPELGAFADVPEFWTQLPKGDLAEQAFAEGFAIDAEEKARRKAAEERRRAEEQVRLLAKRPKSRRAKPGEPESWRLSRTPGGRRYFDPSGPTGYLTECFEPDNCTWDELEAAPTMTCVLFRPGKGAGDRSVELLRGMSVEEAVEHHGRLVDELLRAAGAAGPAGKSEGAAAGEPKAPKAGRAGAVASLTAACKQPLRQRPTGEQVRRRFGLKAIQFGNCSGRASGRLTEEQSLFLCCLEEALADFARVTGIPEPCVGRVARSFAWAARGKGGTGAVAHYEGRGEDNVINLTRRAGAGGHLAHELGHALDYWLAWEFLGLPRSPASGAGPGEEAPESVRGLAAFLTDRGTDFYRAAAKADAGRSRPYFTEPTEMFARAFAGWCAGRLEEAGVESPFLVREPDLAPEGAEAERFAALVERALADALATGDLDAPEPEPAALAACRPAGRPVAVAAAAALAAAGSPGSQMSLF